MSVEHERFHYGPETCLEMVADAMLGAFLAAYENVSDAKAIVIVKVGADAATAMCGFQPSADPTDLFAQAYRAFIKSGYPNDSS